MSYIALYRKWRPLIFEDVVEQEYVVRTLKNAITTHRIAHAYLFCGTRGTGKTTMAKIFARAINCTNPENGNPCNKCAICKGILSENVPDVVEIDAASNNGIDNVREIRDEVIYTPTQAKFKVYIIDEVHMLSTGAFNALLKTLEEPPAHVIFILATTEPHKLPATILSRCQRFDFRRIPISSIVKRLNVIAEKNDISLTPEASVLISKLSDGALRDAISILDQCISIGKNHLTYDDILSVVGIVTNEYIYNMTDAIKHKNIPTALKLIDNLIADGKDIGPFLSELILYFRNLLIFSLNNNRNDLPDLSKEAIDKIEEQCKDLNADQIIRIIKELSSLESTLKWASHPRVLFEIAIIKICEQPSDTDTASILERLSTLEKTIQEGKFIKSTEAKESTEKTVKDLATGFEASTSKKETFSGDAKPFENKSLGTTPVHQNIPVKLKPLGIWQNILDSLKKSGKMVIYSNLFNTKLVELDNKFLAIVFEKKNSINKMIIAKAENTEVIEALTAKELGREVRIKCLMEDEIAGHRSSEKLEEIKDSIIEKAQDIANKLNIPLNIVDA